ncbi:pachytene checkpoint 2 protein isoform X3 [Rhodnius prolixus]
MKVDALCTMIKEELKETSVCLGDRITNFKTAGLAEYLDYIHVCDYEKSKPQNCDPGQDDAAGGDNLSGARPLKINPAELNLFLYRLNRDGSSSECLEDEGQTTAASYTELPSALYEGLWESLIFDSDIKNTLLQYARTMLLYSKCGVDPLIVACNRVVLLHGPPGTGKTSLCKALAHKLAIRLQTLFSKAILVEINTHSLFSKYFSESGKLVSKMFTKILEMVQIPDMLTCILVDEVESLTHSRAAASQGTEPSDAVRVVNAVLTHLDHLKAYPNVLVLTTSNISKAIDIAFIDRADLRVLIPNPSSFAIYTIYHSCIEELIKKHILVGPCPKRISEITEFGNFDPIKSGLHDGNKELIELARISEGLSGRALRKVALRVHATLIPPELNIRATEFIATMATAVKHIKEEMDALSQTYIFK